jgi:hypothetical protein
MRDSKRCHLEGRNVLDAIDTKSLLIFAAVSTYVLGFLFRDQIYTRLLVAIGSSFYIIYYFIVGPTPLWDAIIGSSLIALSSLQGLLVLCWSRMQIAVPKSARHIYRSIGKIEPGLFRRLVKHAQRQIADAPLMLVTQGKAPDYLWYLVSGEATLQRDGQADVTISGPCFIGEIAWMTASPASATIIADGGVELLRWTSRDLRRAMRYNGKLEVALQAIIAQDIARKLAKSRPIEHIPPQPDPEPTLSQV